MKFSTRHWHRVIRFLVLILFIFSIQSGAARAQTEYTLFVPQIGTPVGIPNFVEPESGCSYAGVGGQILDRNGVPQVGLVIKLWGIIDGKNVQFFAVSGGSLRLGPGGFLVKISGHPVTTNGNLSLQVQDITGKVISNPVRLFTKADCAQNLLIVNIKEMVYRYSSYFPLVEYSSSRP